MLFLRSLALARFPEGLLLKPQTCSRRLAAGGASARSRRRRALVVGADALSRFVDWRDRSSCVLFGDGAGAVVLEVAAPSEPADDDDHDSGDSGDDDHDHRWPGIIASRLVSAGSGALSLPSTVAPAGPSRSHESSATSSNDDGMPAVRYGALSMRGADVFAFATREVPAAIAALLEEIGWSIASVDAFALHQANARILDAVATALGRGGTHGGGGSDDDTRTSLDADEVRSRMLAPQLSELGNTGAASLPLLLEAAVRRGDLRRGDRVVFGAFGAGLSWGVVAIVWGDARVAVAADAADHEWALAEPVPAPLAPPATGAAAARPRHCDDEHDSERPLVYEVHWAVIGHGAFSEAGAAMAPRGSFIVIDSASDDDACTSSEMTRDCGDDGDDRLETVHDSGEASARRTVVVIVVDDDDDDEACDERAPTQAQLDPAIHSAHLTVTHSCSEAYS